MIGHLARGGAQPALRLRSAGPIAALSADGALTVAEDAVQTAQIAWTAVHLHWPRAIAGAREGGPAAGRGGEAALAGEPWRMVQILAGLLQLLVELLGVQSPCQNYIAVRMTISAMLIESNRSPGS